MEYILLFNIMSCFYVIERDVISEWRSIWPVDINQYNIRMTTSLSLCHIMACFHMISISLISSGDHIVLTPFILSFIQTKTSGIQIIESMQKQQLVVKLHTKIYTDTSPSGQKQHIIFHTNKNNFTLKIDNIIIERVAEFNFV